ncbi:MAG: WYL domain-containing protein [Lachnospiraceae bacterium]|jgi:hypothetical protein|nr:WYL domain-containing protein [Lachnospiraceae bacterium]
MLFSEVYSAYFNAIAAIITDTLEGEINEKRIVRIIRDRAFSESVLSIIPSLKNGDWLIMDKNFNTPIKNKPSMPLTILQKRWLKALLLDPRIRLFDICVSGLEHVEPLFTPDDFVYFDRYLDGDPFTDESYILHFRTILKAFYEQRRLNIEYRNRHNKSVNGRFIPYRLEYSSKDDKFRLETAGGRYAAYINLSRIKSCTLAENYEGERLIIPKRQEALVQFTLKNERNALERVMLHFSDCRKETRRLDDDTYDVKLTYEALDETEILIRILSFGPMLKVTGPEHFIGLIRERIRMQLALSGTIKI